MMQLPFIKKINANTALALTPSGLDYEEKSDGFTKKAEIVSVIKSGGQPTIREISDETHMSPNLIIVHVKELIANGRVRVVRGDQ